MSQTTTMTLTDFLLARIAEDEAFWSGDAGRDARECQECSVLADGGSGPHYWPGVDRMLAEAAAKRQIVERITDGCPHPYVTPEGRKLYLGGWCLEHCDKILRDLGVIYADHPDYRDEWKP